MADSAPGKPERGKGKPGMDTIKGALTKIESILTQAKGHLGPSIPEASASTPGPSSSVSVLLSGMRALLSGSGFGKSGSGGGGSALSSYHSFFELSLIPVLKGLLGQHVNALEGQAANRATGGLAGAMGGVADSAGALAAEEALWCLVSISGENASISKLLVRGGMVPLLSRLCQLTEDREAKQHSLFLLGAVAGDPSSAREELAKSHALELVLATTAVELARLGFYPFCYGADKAAAVEGQPLVSSDAEARASKRESEGPGPSPLPALSSALCSLTDWGPDTAQPESISDTSASAPPELRGESFSPALPETPDSKAALPLVYPPISTMHGSRQAPQTFPAAPTPMSAYSSSLLRVAVWSLGGLIEGALRVGLPLDLILPVLSACLDNPDSEVAAAACWALSHVCDGPPSHLHAVLCNLFCGYKGRWFELPDASRSGELFQSGDIDPRTAAREAIGVWRLGWFAPRADRYLAALPKPDGSRPSLRSVREYQQAEYPKLITPALPSPAVIASRNEAFIGLDVEEEQEEDGDSLAAKSDGDSANASSSAKPGRTSSDAGDGSGSGVIAAALGRHQALSADVRPPTGDIGQSRQQQQLLWLPSTAAKLARLLKHESARVVKPALRALGNVVCSEDEGNGAVAAAVAASAAVSTTATSEASAAAGAESSPLTDYADGSTIGVLASGGTDEHQKPPQGPKGGTTRSSGSGGDLLPISASAVESDRDFTAAVVSMGVLPFLTRLIGSSPSKEIAKEACWTLSNVAAGSSRQVQAVMESGCLRRVLAACCDRRAEPGMRTESCWVLLNTLTCGTDRQMEVLVRCGAVRALCSVVADPSMLASAVEALEKILQVGERLSAAAASYMSSVQQQQQQAQHGGPAASSSVSAVPKQSAKAAPLLGPPDGKSPSAKVDDAHPPLPPQKSAVKSSAAASISAATALVDGLVLPVPASLQLSLHSLPPKPKPAAPLGLQPAGALHHNPGCSSDDHAGADPEPAPATDSSGLACLGVGRLPIVDPCTEEVLLLEAKALLDTCRRELLSSHGNGSGAQQPPDHGHGNHHRHHRGSGIGNDKHGKQPPAAFHAASPSALQAGARSASDAPAAGAGGGSASSRVSGASAPGGSRLRAGVASAASAGTGASKAMADSGSSISSQGFSTSSSSLPGGSSSVSSLTSRAAREGDAAYRRAAKLWSLHFDECGLCSRVYSRSAIGATKRCEECRITVCGACDCSRYHLSTQLELLSMMDDGASGRAAGLGSKKGASGGYSKEKDKDGKGAKASARKQQSTGSSAAPLVTNATAMKQPTSDSKLASESGSDEPADVPPPQGFQQPPTVDEAPKAQKDGSDSGVDCRSSDPGKASRKKKGKAKDSLQVGAQPAPSPSFAPAPSGVGVPAAAADSSADVTNGEAPRKAAGPRAKATGLPPGPAGALQPDEDDQDGEWVAVGAGNGTNTAASGPVPHHQKQIPQQHKHFRGSAASSLSSGLSTASPHTQHAAATGPASVASTGPPFVNPANSSSSGPATVLPHPHAGGAAGSGARKKGGAAASHSLSTVTGVAKPSPPPSSSAVRNVSASNDHHVDAPPPASSRHKSPLAAPAVSSLKHSKESSDRDRSSGHAVPPVSNASASSAPQQAFPSKPLLVPAPIAPSAAGLSAPALSASAAAPLVGTPSSAGAGGPGKAWGKPGQPFISGSLHAAGVTPQAVGQGTASHQRQPVPGAGVPGATHPTAAAPLKAAPPAAGAVSSFSRSPLPAPPAQASPPTAVQAVGPLAPSIFASTLTPAHSLQQPLLAGSIDISKTIILRNALSAPPPDSSAAGPTLPSPSAAASASAAPPAKRGQPSSPATTAATPGGKKPASLISLSAAGPSEPSTTASASAVPVPSSAQVLPVGVGLAASTTSPPSGAAPAAATLAGLQEQARTAAKSALESLPYPFCTNQLIGAALETAALTSAQQHYDAYGSGTQMPPLQISAHQLLAAVATNTASMMAQAGAADPAQALAVAAVSASGQLLTPATPDNGRVGSSRRGTRSGSFAAEQAQNQQVAAKGSTIAAVSAASTGSAGSGVASPHGRGSHPRSNSFVGPPVGASSAAASSSASASPAKSGSQATVASLLASPRLPPKSPALGSSAGSNGSGDPSLSSLSLSDLIPSPQVMLQRLSSAAAAATATTTGSAGSSAARQRIYSAGGGSGGLNHPASASVSTSNRSRFSSAGSVGEAISGSGSTGFQRALGLGGLGHEGTHAGANTIPSPVTGSAATPSAAVAAAAGAHPATSTSSSTGSSASAAVLLPGVHVPMAQRSKALEAHAALMAAAAVASASAGTAGELSPSNGVGDSASSAAATSLIAVAAASNAMQQEAQAASKFAAAVLARTITSTASSSGPAGSSVGAHVPQSAAGAAPPAASFSSAGLPIAPVGFFGPGYKAGNGGGADASRSTGAAASSSAASDGKGGASSAVGSVSPSPLSSSAAYAPLPTIRPSQPRISKAALAAAGELSDDDDDDSGEASLASASSLGRMGLGVSLAPPTTGQGHGSAVSSSASFLATRFSGHPAQLATAQTSTASGNLGSRRSLVLSSSATGQAEPAHSTDGPAPAFDAGTRAGSSAERNGGFASEATGLPSLEEMASLLLVGTTGDTAHKSHSFTVADQARSGAIPAFAVPPSLEAGSSFLFSKEPDVSLAFDPAAPARQATSSLGLGGLSIITGAASFEDAEPAAADGFGGILSSSSSSASVSASLPPFGAPGVTTIFSPNAGPSLLISTPSNNSKDDCEEEQSVAGENNTAFVAHRATSRNASLPFPSLSMGQLVGDTPENNSVAGISRGSAEAAASVSVELPSLLGLRATNTAPPEAETHSSRPFAGLSLGHGSSQVFAGLGLHSPQDAVALSTGVGTTFWGSTTPSEPHIREH